MLTLSDIIATLQRHWSANLPIDVPTQFPGVPLDAARLTAWIEFWPTELRELPHRDDHPNSMAVLVDVHCFSREGNKRHVAELADAVRSHLGRRDVPVHESADPESPVGLLRFREPVVRDLTREDPQQRPLPLQHVVVSLHAVAEAHAGAAAGGLPE